MLPTEPALLDRLADRGWPALETEQLGGWTLRASGGVTNRANSVLASAEAPDLDDAIGRAEAWYSERGLPAVFQVSPASPPGLAVALARRHYREHSPTDILVAGSEAVARTASSRSSGVVADVAPPGWLDTWWEVDGRGGDRERETVARILSGGPALYAWSGDPAAPDAVARLALVGEWGGLYAVATLPRARRRGLARSLAGALAVAASDRGVENLWLQVLADNAAAHALYAELGFVQVSGYSYWEKVRLARPR
ncbi:GNAT family N-acetyltransferase [Leifsonia shinshuensis]|uniref:GNAT family N-acetyltransferase n=1 Tax=Leifsonia shinshuensis TaxID=150026 RepID=UPI001F51371E|nr:GNAT family N-acetyltransferase [Leifsonia shinshuensis]MCI0157201.1 GNAT family N-acetyltransferase [Leifsonia shinshuensis]